MSVADDIIDTIKWKMFNRIEEEREINLSCQAGLPVFPEGAFIIARLYDEFGDVVQDVELRTADEVLSTPKLAHGPIADGPPQVSTESHTYRLSPHFAVMGLSETSVAQDRLFARLPRWATTDSWGNYTIVAVRYELDTASL